SWQLWLASLFPGSQRCRREYLAPRAPPSDLGSSGSCLPPHPYDTLHEKPRRNDSFGVQRSELDHVFDLDHRNPRRRGHDGPEVARGFPVHQVAPTIRMQSLDKRIVCTQRIFQYVVAPMNVALLFAFGKRSTRPRRGVEPTYASAGGADAFSQIALRHEFKFY